METIYVLIETHTGKLEPVLSEIKRMVGIIEVSAVTGVYDIVAKIQTGDITTALSTVAKEIRNIPGIKAVESLVVVRV
jgi:DNA-binding Lrp family transcriptional regulator